MIGIIIILTQFTFFVYGSPTELYKSPYAYQSSNYEKIVGGYEVEPHSIPHQVSIQLKGGLHRCGGSIINEETILSAAHCFGVLNPDGIEVVAGAHNLENKTGFEQIRAVSRIVIHKQFGTFALNNDISILKLSEKLEFNEKVNKVKLPEKDKEFKGNATVTGWGTTAAWDSLSPVLLAVDIRVVSLDLCKNFFPGKIDETMICAAAQGKDACQGDSGGPMTCGKNKIHCGIVSYGKGFTKSDYPRVYTKTSYFIDWINKYS